MVSNLYQCDKMVTIKDGCGCDPCDCDWKQKLKEAYSRAIQSVNKIGDNDGSVYFPDGTGFVKLPLPRQSDVAQIRTNTEDIADLKVRNTQLQADINAETTAREDAITAEATAREAAITAEASAREAKDTALDAEITRIDNTDTEQNQRIQDNAGKIQYTYNELVTTEKTVATHNSEIITIQANNQALAKSLVSDVLMTDGTTAGSVQVSIEKGDGTLITSANYRWGKDIGIRLEAGTQAGYVKAVISLSDGTELVSNEYKIVEVLESDVYVTAITLIADQAAGTLGGNISYSNGTSQTINSVSVPTAPGVTSAIEALQGRMTAVEQKNTTQNADITSLKNRVQAIEDTPGVGQFGAGKLGTIAGSTADGRVKAEDDGTGSVNGWSDLKQRVTTTEEQIVTAQNNISALDRTVSQQTTDISGLKADVTNIQNKNTAQDQSIAANASAIEGKVSIAQGADNAGKVLTVGNDGNLTVSTAKKYTKITSIDEVYTKSIDFSTTQSAGNWSAINNSTVNDVTILTDDSANYYIQKQTTKGSSTTASFYYGDYKVTDPIEYLKGLIKDTFKITDFAELSNGHYSVEILIQSASYSSRSSDNTVTFDINNGVIENFTKKQTYPIATTSTSVTWRVGVISITPL